MAAAPKKADRNRWRLRIQQTLEDFPRQYDALESAMGAFGDDFDIDAFKEAYETRTDMDAYNRVQAVERALGRVQNYVAELAIAGVNLAGLDLAGTDHDGQAQRAFEALRNAEVLDGALCRRLKRAQQARILVEHAYVEAPAGNVHRAAELVHDTSTEFLLAYRAWIVQYLQ